MHKRLILVICTAIAAPLRSHESFYTHIDQEMDMLTARDVTQDSFEMNDLDFDRIESFIENNPNSFVLEPPSKLMIWLRIIGSPILLAYLETKQKVLYFFHWWYNKILHRASNP